MIANPPPFVLSGGRDHKEEGVAGSPGTARAQRRHRHPAEGAADTAAPALVATIHFERKVKWSCDFMGIIDAVNDSCQEVIWQRVRHGRGEERQRRSKEKEKHGD